MYLVTKLLWTWFEQCKVATVWVTMHGQSVTIISGAVGENYSIV